MLPLNHLRIISTLIICCFLSQRASAENIVTNVIDKSKAAILNYRKNLHDWDSLIRGFRRGHNFAMAGCVASTQWSGDLFSGNNSTNEACINLAYNYHVKQYKYLGFYLGTEAEYSFLQSSDNVPIEDKPIVYQLPGITGGINFYFSPGFRFMLQSSYTLQRIERLGVNNGQDLDTYNITLQVFEYGFVTDFFFDLSSGVRFFYKEKIRQNPKGFNMVGSGYSLGLGLVYHLL